MRSGNERRWYRCVDASLLRAAVQPRETVLPAWPTVQEPGAADVDEWRAWLRSAWADSRSAEAVEIASPVLASRIESVLNGAQADLREDRRLALSLSRYLLRAGSRATPFGLFAGVAPAGFGAVPGVHFGDGHRIRVQPAASWLDAMITVLESDARLLAELPVMTSSLCRHYGGRLLLPARGTEAATDPAEVSLRLTPAVRLLMDAATTPVRCGDLIEMLAVEFPTKPIRKAALLISQLVRHRVLVSALRTPSTATDPLGYLLDQLDAVSADEAPRLAPLVRGLRDVDTRLAVLGRTPPGAQRRTLRSVVVERMRALAPVPEAPLAVDSALDARVTLPQAVAAEIEVAATVLARLAAYPRGTAAWQAYRERFEQRYGSGTLVPVAELTDRVRGLGFPDGYPGSAPQEAETGRTARDAILLNYAQTAALEGVTEVVLTDAMIAELERPGERPANRIPPHLEMNVEVHAASMPAIVRGEFTLRVLGVSRAAGTMAGRFLPLLEPSDRERMADVYRRMPTLEAGAVPVQLSFPPLLARADHVTRAPQTIPSVISLGEHCGAVPGVIPLQDLAVGCTTGHRLYLASLATGRVLEAFAPTSLNFRTEAHTPPLARFLAEIARADAAQVTGFDWGVAAALPFRPALRYRRTVLTPAHWRLTASDLAAGLDSPAQWARRLHAWRDRRRVPSRVLLAEGDRQLLLDLDRDVDSEILRTHVRNAGPPVLIEAARPEDNGWLGGRAHSVVVPLVSTRGQAPPAVVPQRTALTRGNHAKLPGYADRLHATLCVPQDLQDELIASRIPLLLSRFEPPTTWWFERSAESASYLRLSIALNDAFEYGFAARTLGTWAADACGDGVMSGLRLETCYARTDRSTAFTEVANPVEAVFHRDSELVVEQLRAAERPPAEALAAANITALAVGFLGSPNDAVRWVVRFAKLKPPRRVPRSLHTEAVLLADPTGDFAAFHKTLASDSLTAAWRRRDEALAEYRASVEAETVDRRDEVLAELVYAHTRRVFAPDGAREGVALHLARAAALAFTHTEGAT